MLVGIMVVMLQPPAPLEPVPSRVSPPAPVCNPAKARRHCSRGRTPPFAPSHGAHWLSGNRSGRGVTEAACQVIVKQRLCGSGSMVAVRLPVQGTFQVAKGLVVAGLARRGLVVVVEPVDRLQP